MKNVTRFPQKLSEVFRHPDQINHRTWQKELDFKESTQQDLYSVIKSITSSKDWYRDRDVGVYIDRINRSVKALDDKDVYFRNVFDARLISRTYMRDELDRELRLREYQKQKHSDSVLQDMYDHDIYLTHKSLRTLDRLDSDWVIRRVDQDEFNHRAIYYQEVDGDVIVQFSYRLINAIDYDTHIKEQIFEID